MSFEQIYAAYHLFKKAAGSLPFSCHEVLQRNFSKCYRKLAKLCFLFFTKNTKQLMRMTVNVPTVHLYEKVMQISNLNNPKT